MARKTARVKERGSMAWLMLYNLAAQVWPDQKCLFTLRSGDLGGTTLLWRPWWHLAAVGPRVLVVHAGGALFSTKFAPMVLPGALVKILLSATGLWLCCWSGLRP